MDTGSRKKKIIDYFKKNLKKGYTPESLKWALFNQGYSKSLIEEAIKELNNELAHNAPELKEKPKITYEILDEQDKPIIIQKPWWKKILE